jgi:hypothetical protein
MEPPCSLGDLIKRFKVVPYVSYFIRIRFLSLCHFLRSEQPHYLSAPADKYILIDDNKSMFSGAVRNLEVRCYIVPRNLTAPFAQMKEFIRTDTYANTTIVITTCMNL